MTQEHPITPPPELVEQWMTEIWHEGTPVRVAASDLHIAIQAANWGANQELEACISAVLSHPGFEQPELFAELLRANRRPKPKSQADEALECLEQTMILLMPVTGRKKVERLGAIRAALERLRELENGND